MRPCCEPVCKLLLNSRDEAALRRLNAEREREEEGERGREREREGKRARAREREFVRMLHTGNTGRFSEVLPWSKERECVVYWYSNSVNSTPQCLGQGTKRCLRHGCPGC
jgi:hypothetical protein